MLKQVTSTGPVRLLYPVAKNSEIFGPRRRRGIALLGAAVSLGAVVRSSSAATLYWNGVGNSSTTTGWNDVGSWSTSATATTPNPSAIPGIADSAVFSISSITTTPQVVDLNANQSAAALVFLGTDTGGVTIQNGSAGLYTLSIGTGGISLNSGTGALTFGAGVGLNFNATGTTVVTGAGNTITDTGTYFSVGTTTTSATVALNMSGLSTFVYNNSAGNFNVGSGGNTATTSFNMAANTTITASAFTVGPSGVGTGPAIANISFGQTTTINANTINLSGQKFETNFGFAGNVAGQSLTLQGTGGSGTFAAMTLGTLNNTSAAVYPNTINTSNGTISAYLSNLTLATANAGGVNTTRSSALSSTMITGAGIVEVNGTMTLGQLTSGGSGSGTTDIEKATGTFTMNGTNVYANTIKFADSQFAYGSTSLATGIFNLNSGNLYAANISTGGTNTPTVSTFNWSAGMISNLTGSVAGSGLVAQNLNISGASTSTPLAVTLIGTAAHNLNASSGQSINFASTAIIAGPATSPLVLNGAGTVILAGASTYAGATNLASGTLSVANTTGSGTGTGNVTLNGGVLASGTVGSIGGNVLAGSAAHIIAPGGLGSLGTLTVNGLTTSPLTTLNFDFGPGSGTAVVGDELILGSGNVNIATGTNITVSGTPSLGTSYRIIGGTLTGITNLSAFTITSTAPVGDSYYLSNAVDPGFIDLVVSAPPQTLTWNNSGGSGDGMTWDTTSQNWNNGTSPTTFSSFDQDNVTFNDLNNHNYNVSIAQTVTPGSVTVTTSSIYTFTGSGSIAGVTGLLLNGTGTLVLGTANTFTGNTNVASGTLDLANTLALQNSVLISGGVTFDASVGSNAFTIGALTGSGAISLKNTAGSPVALSVGGTNASTGYSGVLSGTGSLVKIGTGTFTPSGSSTYTGGITLSAGVVNLGGVEVPGVSGPLGQTGLVTFAGGTLQYSTTNTVDYSSRFSSASGQLYNIDTNGQTVVFASPLTSPSGILTKLGAGTLGLAAASTYSGATIINAGTLQLQATNALPTATSVIFTGPGTLDINSQTQAIVSLNVSSGVAANLANGTIAVGTESIILAGSTANTSSLNGGAIAIAGGTIDASAAGGTGVPSGVVESIGTQITGTGGLNILAYGNITDTGGSNTSVLSLTNTANSFTGGVTISTGLVNVAAGDGIFGNGTTPSTNAVTIAAGAGLLATGSVTMNTSSIVLSNAGNHYLRVYGGDVLTLNGVISDGGAGGSLYKTDGGTVVLAGANTYTGATNATNGVLTVTGNESAATGSWYVGAGNVNAITVNFNAGSNIVVASANTVQIGGLNATAAANVEALNVSGTVVNNGTLFSGRNAVGGGLIINTGGNWTQYGAMSIAPGLGSGFSGYLTVNAGGIFTYNNSSAAIIDGATGNASNGAGAIAINGGIFNTSQGFSNAAGTANGISSVSIGGGGQLVLLADVPQLTTVTTTGKLVMTVGNGSGGVINTNGHSTTITNVINNVSGQAGILVKSGAGTLTLASATNNYSGGTIINAGTLVLSGGVASAGTGTTTVNGGNAIYQNTAASAINTLLKTGYNASAGGYWNGPGINSATAANDSTHLTAVGMYQPSSTITFEGVTLNPTDVAVKFTYYGDANLSGVVDGSDYTLIDNGYLSQLTGWQNGDFNYDGIVNGSDYTLIDNAFNTQGAAFSAQVATATAQISGPGATSAVPEPATLGLVGLGLTGLLSRRRRR